MSSTKTADLSAAADGIATTFAAPEPYVAGSLQVWLDGMRLRPGIGNDYQETSSTQFLMAVAPLLGAVLLVNYEVEDALVVAAGTFP